VWVPFGNMYFVTQACGGAGEYSKAARKCYNRLCGAGSPSPPADCFTGQLVCQHHEPECEANRILACAKPHQSGDDTIEYHAFLSCVQVRFDDLKNGATSPSALSQTCAESSGLSLEPISACYDDTQQSTQALVEAAKATPEHEVVPLIRVNGKQLENPDLLIYTVCYEYSKEGGQEPEGCPFSLPTVTQPPEYPGMPGFQSTTEPPKEMDMQKKSLVIILIVAAVLLFANLALLVALLVKRRCGEQEEDGDEEEDKGSHEREPLRNPGGAAPRSVPKHGSAANSGPTGPGPNSSTGSSRNRKEVQNAPTVPQLPPHKQRSDSGGGSRSKAVTQNAATVPQLPPDKRASDRKREGRGPAKSDDSRQGERPAPVE